MKTEPSPSPPEGSIKVLTDKTIYLVGEEVLITVWYTRPTDWCLYHLVKCEIFDSGNRLCGSRKWDDRYTSFPVTWGFRLLQPYTYTIIASFWHNGETKGGEDKTTIRMIETPEYVRIADVLWIPPNTYEITVEARWPWNCYCLEHKVTLEGGYALDWPMIQVLKVIASWTVPQGQSLRAKATWTCPKEGRYRLIATASHDLKDEFVSFFVPEFPYPTMVLVAGTLLAIIIGRKEGNKKLRAT